MTFRKSIYTRYAVRTCVLCDSTLPTADVSWSTAPSTPVAKQKTIAEQKSSDSSITSYEKAIISSDALWEWNTSGNEAREQLLQTDKTEQKPPPTHVSDRGMTDSNHPPKPTLKEEKQPPSGIEVVRPTDTKVQVGFFPTTTLLNTTNPTELPGSRAPVITAPPGSKVIDNRPRAKSIEEADSHLKKYAPKMPKDPMHSEFRDGLIDSGACLGLASYLSSSLLDSTADSGKGSSLAQKYPRKVSIAASTTSVSCV